MIRALVIMGIALAIPGVAHAYIGPGLGAGAIAAVLGVVGSIFLALFAVLYYPIKRALKRRRPTSAPGETQDGKDGLPRSS
jgi:membrane protein implicated in regulation of membrane protease activity